MVGFTRFDMAILDKWTLDFISNSVEQTVRLGVRLGELQRSRDLLCMSGDLGTGKTAFARGIGRGWGAALRVTSPSYVLVNQYPRLRDGRILYHVDCYRLENREDIVTAGIEDVLDSEGAVMIEWAERISELLPEDHLWIEFGYVNLTRRTLRFTAKGDRSAQILDEFKRSAFGI
jgi:tRNA threonylcarbamoyladenosine biosynthesis protein TsaE